MPRNKGRGVGRENILCALAMPKFVGSFRPPFVRVVIRAAGVNEQLPPSCLVDEIRSSNQDAQHACQHAPSSLWCSGVTGPFTDTGPIPLTPLNLADCTFA